MHFATILNWFDHINLIGMSENAPLISVKVAEKGIRDRYAPLLALVGRLNL